MKSKADVICLQETHLAPPDVPQLPGVHKSFPHIFRSSLNVKKVDTAILIKNTVAFTLLEKITDPRSRFVILIWEIDSIQYTMISIYASNKGQLLFLCTTFHKIKRSFLGRLIIAGDFNVVTDKCFYRSQGCSRPALDIQSLLQEENLHDIWRYQHSNERDYAYYSPSKVIHSRTDMILIDAFTLMSALHTSIGYITSSDHDPVMITLSCGPNHPGSSL